MNAKFLFLSLLGFGILSAHSCKDLCERFGDYEGCQKMARGIVDCDRRFPSLPSQLSRKDVLERSIYLTPWESMGEGIRFRFRVEADPRRFVFTAETDPPSMNEGYSFVMTPGGIASEHMVDESLSCRRIGQKRLQCKGDSGTPYRNASVDYRLKDDGRFDLRFYSENPQNGRWVRWTLRLHNDAKYIYEEYYLNGKKQSGTKRYRIIRSYKKAL